MTGAIASGACGCGLFHLEVYNPGPTKGTALAKRQDTPVFVRLLGPLLRLMSRPVGVLSEEFLRSLEPTSPGICWMNAGKTIARSRHLQI